MKDYFVLNLLIMVLLFSGCKGGYDSAGKMGKGTIPFEFPDLQPPVFQGETFNILDFGAKAG